MISFNVSRAANKRDMNQLYPAVSDAQYVGMEMAR